jgi:hypothetical protein
VFRVLQPGRKLFINIMNLPVRLEDGSFRTLNLMGRTVQLCEDIGFIFKRDIIWQKDQRVRAPFGTYPYPGGILLNNMHEFILEMEKPSTRTERARKYAHVSPEDRERSRLDKEFWLSIKNSDVWLMAPQGSGTAVASRSLSPGAPGPAHQGVQLPRGDGARSLPGLGDHLRAAAWPAATGSDTRSTHR